MIFQGKCRPVVALLTLCLLAPSLLRADEQPDPAAGRRLLLRGKYAQAAKVYSRTASQAPRAAVGLARALEAQGKSAEARAALERLAGGDAEVDAELARLAFARGDREQSARHLASALAADARQPLAIWVESELARSGGRLAAATAAAGRLVESHNRQPYEGAESLRWVAAASARLARWQRNPAQFRRLVTDVYPGMLRREPDFWPAHLDAGLLFLEKHNFRDAEAELAAALAINPNAAAVHAAVARLALAQRDVRRAVTSVRRALALNPQLAAAWRVKADLAWANFQVDEAIRLLKTRALPLNPRSEETLGRLAAAYLLQDGAAAEREHARFGQLVKQVDARNPHAGDFYFVLAGRLEERHKLDLAERFLQEAIRRMPRKLGPRALLGAVYMDMGREDEARPVLQQAFEQDPFNVRVKNTLEVLDLLGQMRTLDAAGCEFRFDEGDELLIRYVSRAMEDDYPRLCALFGYRPPQPPLVEIFRQARGASGHDWFGTRMVGLPYVGTVAACTGRIVAMVSPNDPSLKRRYNWAQTLRHEMVHVITLQQTDFNIPHWYTEGLAVWCEGCPRPQRWNTILARRLAEDRLYDLGDINFGFTRPDSSGDWALAYCQAELYVEYMLEGRHEQVLRRLLDAYAENLSTAEAIERVFGVSLDAFERGYRQYVGKVAGGISTVPARRKTDFATLLDRRRQHLDDPDLAAEVACGYLQRGARREALDAAQDALRLRTNQPLATYVVARLHLGAGRAEVAERLLAGCLDRGQPEPKVLDLLARLKLKRKEFDAAAELYRLGLERQPENRRWRRGLAKVYLLAGDDRHLAQTLAPLAVAEPDDPAIRKKLARLALSRGDFAEAARWARLALEIDVTDAEIHQALAEACLGSHNDKQAVEELLAAVELRPQDAGLRLALAEAYRRAGRIDDARGVLNELLDGDPGNSQALKLLETLEANNNP